MWRVLAILSITNIAIIRTDSPQENWAFVGNPIAFFPPCKNQDKLVILFEPGLPPGEENQYQMRIDVKFIEHSKVIIRFDTEASVKLLSNSAARIKVVNNYFEIIFFKDADALYLRVKGPPTGAVPYLESFVINTVEYCKEPLKGFLDRYIQGVSDQAEILPLIADEGCGRRKIQHTELIVNGSPTVAGDWPWHVAIYRFEHSTIDYICGGTLLSTYYVLTAAHCVTNKGLVVLPETRNVVLGKHNLVGGDIGSQEKEVHKITIHEGFKPTTLERDIALMKLKTAVEFTDYIQPVCLWHADLSKRLPQKQILGTVVGWGFDLTDTLSPTLQRVLIPKLADSTCIKNNPVFFSNKLDGFKFCAGYANGTSVCNGDSGGGFHVFVPDKAGNTAHDASGSWHVAGIVSLTVKRQDAAICEPLSYAVFTDLAKYGGWMRKNMK